MEKSWFGLEIQERRGCARMWKMAFESTARTTGLGWRNGYVEIQQLE
jgi:hypothetical protein